MWQFLLNQLRGLVDDPAAVRESLREILALAAKWAAKTANKADDMAVKLLQLIVNTDALWALIEPILPKLLTMDARLAEYHHEVVEAANGIAVATGRTREEVLAAFASMTNLNTVA